MEKSSFFHCNLMKRRYSVPETVMRKHTLQEVALRKQTSDSGFTNILSSSNLENETDENPQTDETSIGIQTSIVASSKKGTKNKKRKCFRSMRRSTSSYCQYRYSMSAFSRKILSRRSSKFARNVFSSDNPNDSSVVQNVDTILGNDISSAGRSAFTTNDDSIKTSDGELTSAPKSERQYFPKISRTPEPPTTLDFTSGDKSERVNQVSTDSDSPSNSFDLSQNLNAINTDFPLIFQSESSYVNPTRSGDSTRREKHSISIKISPFYQSPHSNVKRDYLKTEVKIGIDHTTTQLESTRNKTDDENEKECLKYDFMNGNQKTAHELQSGNTLYLKYQKTRQLPGSSNRREKIEEGKERKIDIVKQNFPCAPTRNDLPMETLTFCRPADIEGAASHSDREDCSVPMSESMCCSPRSKENQPLNIQVNVGKVDSLEEMIRRSSRGRPVNVLPTQPSNEKYERNTRTTLNYLFQKLGNSYPKPQKRLLLKNPTFVDYNSRSHSNFGQYYSGLPRLLDKGASDLLYNVSPIGESFVPPMKKLDDNTQSNNELSDSDISIADSLEDSQFKSPGDGNAINKYRQYDNRPARGDVDRLVKASKMKEEKSSKVANSISYYLHFLNIESSRNEEGDESVHQQEVVDEHYVPPHIPTNLLEKLNKRSNSISKHSSCMGITSRSKEFVHKQIQTCFNARESLRRKRRQRITAEPSIDKRIARVLMTGLKIQEEESPSPDLSHNQNDDRPTDGEGGIVDTILRDEEVKERINLSSFRHHLRTSEKSKKIRYPTTETSKGKDPICNFDQELTTRESNFSRYRYHQGRLKYFKDRKVRKRRDGENGVSTSSDDTNDVEISSAVPMIHKSAFNREKRDFRVKNGRHKAKIFKGVRRFCQKFEAIPEEMTNNSSERHDIETNKFIAEDDKAGREEILSATDQKKVRLPTEICDEKVETNEEKQETNSVKEDAEAEIKFENTEDAEDSDTRDSKSQKRGDLLYNVNAEEELITLSKGWINFYLLKATNVMPDGAPNQMEEAEKDENVAHLYLPQQYMLQIQATPQHPETNSSHSMKPQKRISPELHTSESPPCQRQSSLESKWYNISSKSQSTLPGIGDTKISSSNSGIDAVSPISCVNHCNENVSPSSTATVITDQAKDNPSFPTKLETCAKIVDEIHPRSTKKTQENSKIMDTDLEGRFKVIEAQSEIGQTAETISPTFWSEPTQTSTSTTETAATDLNPRSTTSQSTSTATSSNCSISSANREVELSVLRTDTAIVEENSITHTTRRHKTIQPNQLPQSYHHSSRQQGYRRSSSVDFNRKTVNKKNTTSMVDIEMRLLVKNHCYKNDIENRSHSWKFTLSSEDASRNDRQERSSKTRSTHSVPNQNSHYQNQNHVVRLSSCSENSSTSTTSSCSFSEEKQINEERKLISTSELNSYPLRPNNKLTVTGSSITPESKPKPPTMSEKDITRTRLSRHATSNHK